MSSHSGLFSEGCCGLQAWCPDDQMLEKCLAKVMVAYQYLWGQRPLSKKQLQGDRGGAAKCSKCAGNHRIEWLSWGM